MTQTHEGPGWPAWIDDAYAAWNRGDAGTLKAFAAPGIEVVPLLSGITSSGPWSGHAGIEHLVEQAMSRWGRFALEPVDVSEDGERYVVRARVTATTHGEGRLEIVGEVLHVFELTDGLVTRFEARRAD